MFLAKNITKGSEKILIRLGKGIYLFPKMDPLLGLLYPSLKDIAHTIAAKEKVLIRPTGASVSS